MQRLMVILLGALALLVTPAFADEQQPTVYFALIATPGPHWDATRKFQEQRGIAEHVAYLKHLRDEGTLVMAGPFLDGSGELTIISVQGIEDAKLVAIGDPAAGSEVLSIAVKPWLIGISKD